MKKLCYFLISALVLAGAVCGVFPAAAAPETGGHDLFVSPEGDDAAEGTMEAPLRTPLAAKEKLKSLKGTLGENERVCVWLRAGRYELSQPLIFTSADLPNVTWAAWKNEEVVFSGAKEISGFTEETVNGVRAFVKDLGPEDPAGFRSLFCGSRALRAPRWPESGYLTVKALAPEDDLFTEENTPWEFTLGQRSFYADPADLPAFSDPENVQVRILHYWHDELMYLTGVDPATGKLSLSRPSSMKIRDIDRYYFENVFEALDAPGEWYLDRAQRKLYYIPEAGERPDTLVLRAPVTDKLIEIEGVSGIGFSHIRFTETDWKVPVPTGDWADWRVQYDIDALQAALDVDGALTVRGAQNIRFAGCEFLNIGADGVKLMDGVKHSRIENCLFENIAATAVFVGGPNGSPGDPDVAEDITVTNNRIAGYGRKFFCAIGVHITYCDGAEISHNEISDGYYTGISCGWTWGYTHHLTNRILITDNLIYNIGQGWLSDMGGIYMLGIQPGTVLSGNVIHNVAADPGEGGYGGWGIYLDEGSSRMLVENNLVFRCGSQSFNIHYGEGNVIRNNIGAFSAEGQVSVGTRGGEAHATATYYDNIFLTDGTPIYLYMYSPAHFYDNGNLFWEISGKDLTFCTDSGTRVLSLQAAEKEGYLHNPTVADPGFADPVNNDFALSADSPALKLNFKPWDYAEAGTLPGTVVGFSLAGGATAYNENVSEVSSEKTYGGGRGFIARTALFVLAGLAGAAVLVKGLFTEKSAAVRALLSLAAAAVCGVFVYRTFVNWDPAAYVIWAVAMHAFVALAATVGAKKRGKKPAVTFLLWLAVPFAVFFGVTLLFNNVLRIGESVAICISMSCTALFALIAAIRMKVR